MQQWTRTLPVNPKTKKSDMQKKKEEDFATKKEKKEDFVGPQKCGPLGVGARRRPDPHLPELQELEGLGFGV